MLRIVSGRFLMLHVVRRMVLEEAEGKPAGARPSPGVRGPGGGPGGPMDFCSGCV